MAKLIIKFNNEVVDHVDLKQGDMKVGRKPGSDVFLDNLAVSGEHANVFTIGEDSFLQDLNSTNGTFVNNKKITKHHLHNGDAIAIGKHTLVYLNDTTNRPTDFAKTVVINPGARETPATRPGTASAPERTTVETAAAPKPERHGAIFVMNGVNSGRRIELNKKLTNLGRSGRRAGTITRVEDGFTLAAGVDETPKLNGRPVTASGVKLRNGDIIEVGGTRLQFYFTPPVAGHSRA